MRLALLLVAALGLLAAVSSVSGEVAVRGGEKVANGPTFVKDLTDATFEHDTQASTGSTTGDWFVEFYAPPTWASLSVWARDEQVPVSIAALDATESVRTAKRFDIRGFPTLKLISQGKVYDYEGTRTLEALQKYLEGREWLKDGVKSRVIPGEIGLVDHIRDTAREAVSDLTMFLYQKPGGAVILMTIGLLVGILGSMLVFIIFIEKRPIVHHIAAPITHTAQPSAAAATANGTPSTPPAATATIPATNPVAKKAE